MCCAALGFFRVGDANCVIGLDQGCLKGRWAVFLFKRGNGIWGRWQFFFVGFVKHGNNFLFHSRVAPKMTAGDGSCASH